MVDFEREILPLFNANCLACHNETKAKAGLVLETPQSILAGGDSGPSVVPGKPSESLLLIAAAHLDEDVIMPPQGNKSKAENLKPEELGLLRLWISQGAEGEVRGVTNLDWQPISKRVQPIYSVAMSESGRYVAYGKGSKASVYELPTREHVGRLIDPALGDGRAHLDMVNSIAFHPNNKLVATGGFREIKLWERTPEIEMFSVFKAAHSGLRDAAVSGDGLVIGLAFESGLVQCLEFSTGRVLWRSGRTVPSIRSLSLSHDGHQALAITDDQSLFLLGGGTLADGMTLSEAVESVEWDHSGRRFATIDNEGTPSFWQRGESGDFESTKLSLAEPASAQYFMPDGSDRLLIGTVPGRLYFIDLQSGENSRSIEIGKSVEQLATDARGDRLVIASGDGHASLWDLARGKRLFSFSGARPQQRRFQEAQRHVGLLKGGAELASAALEKAKEQLEKAIERVATAEKEWEGKTAAHSEAVKKLTKSESTLVDAKELDVKLDEELDAAEASLDQARLDYREGTADLRALVASVRKLETDQEASDVIEGGQLDAQLGKVADLAIVVRDFESALESFQSGLQEKKKEAKDAVEVAEKAIAADRKNFDAASQAVKIASDELTLAKESVERERDVKRQAEASLGAANVAVEKGGETLSQMKAAVDVALLPFQSIQFTSAGDRVVAVGEDASASFWWADTGEELDYVPSESDVIVSHLVTDRALLRVRMDGKASLNPLDQSWHLSRTIQVPGFADRINALNFSEDGKLLAAGGGDPSRSGSIKVWDMETEELVHDFIDVHSDVVFAVQFSPDGNLLASASADRFARIFDLRNDKPVYAFEGHTHYVMDVSWQADGRVLISAGADGMAKVWDVTTGKRKKNIEGFKKEVTGVSFIGATAEVVASSGDSTIAVYGLDGKRRRSMSESSDFVLTESVTSDGRLVAAGGQKGLLRIWDVATGKVLMTVD